MSGAIVFPGVGGATVLGVKIARDTGGAVVAVTGVAVGIYVLTALLCLTGAAIGAWRLSRRGREAA